MVAVVVNFEVNGSLQCFAVCIAMGVRGLTQFVESKGLLVSHILRNTKLVIDGNNLCYYLYRKCKVADIFGGDYDEFAEKCKEFFNSLNVCGIEAYVVFDGAEPIDGSKTKTMIKRARKRIKLSSNKSTTKINKDKKLTEPTNQQSEDCLLPILAFNTLRSALADVPHVKHFTCQHEADRHVAKLANHWNCPVMTQDSDFFVYDISAGVVSLDVSDPHVPDTCGIPCKLYRLKTMVDLLGFKSSGCVALFATILGNDIVDKQHSDKILKILSIEHPGKMDGTVVADEVVRWLKSHADDALEVIEEKIGDDIGLISIVNQSIKSYTISDSDTFINNYFTNTESANGRSTSKWMVQQFGSPISGEFLSRIYSGEISAAVIQVIVHKRLMFDCQIENLKFESSYETARPLRQIFYGILLPSDPSTQVMHVDEYTRRNDKLYFSQVAPVSKLVNGRDVPNLNRVLENGIKERYEFLMDALGAARVGECYAADVRFLVAVVRYWIRNAIPKVNELHIHTLLLCMACLGSLESVIQSDSSAHTTDRIASRNTTTSRDSRAASRERWKSVKRESSPHLDINISHSFAQFQACLQVAYDLSSVLLFDSSLQPDIPIGLHDISKMDPQKVFNGTEIHKQFLKLCRAGPHETNVSHIARRFEHLSPNYVRLFKIVNNGLGEDTVCIV